MTAYDEDLVAEVFEHILTDRAHMHCPVRQRIVETTPPPPVSKTQEEKIAFRKAWDARVDAGREHG